MIGCHRQEASLAAFYLICQPCHSPAAHLFPASPPVRVPFPLGRMREELLLRDDKLKICQKAASCIDAVKFVL